MEVDGIDNKQILRDFFHYRLNIVFGDGSGIYYFGGDFSVLELLANQGPKPSSPFSVLPIPTITVLEP